MDVESAATLAADLPEQPLALRLVGKSEVAEFEQGVEVAPLLNGVVVALPEVLGVDPLGQVDELQDRLGLRLDRAEVPVRHDAGRNHLPHIDHQHRVVCDHGAAVLGHDGRRRHVLGITDLADRIDDVVRKLLHRIVHRELACGPGPVVVDAQPAPDVEVLDLEAHPAGLRVHPRGLLEGRLGAANVVDLRSDMDVEHLELLARARALDAAERLDEGQRPHAELGKLPARVLPLPAAARAQLDAQAERRLQVQGPCEVQRHVEVCEVLGNDDGQPAQPAGLHRETQVELVLESVARNQRALGQRHRQRRDQLGLAADLQAVVVPAAGRDQALQHLGLLVDLDRVRADVPPAVVVLLDGGGECLVQRGEPLVENLGKPKQEGRRLAGLDLLPDDPRRCRSRGPVSCAGPRSGGPLR